ncbi:folliculin-interacting protein 1 isoform X2 [Nilaparvata lugens]|uniref:folliculin-interacting protein 1 isoform X2 n=1 Tax=Nilaparvata lugens TaxID=108931 RepID=UPI00193CAC5B|nr:folliculin-interacting protein 1 isoform X2 [Nilaparvata lugens]
MALFARFFSQRKNVKKENTTQQSFINKNTQRRPFDFELDQVRVLLFRECDWRGRKLLFDSAAKPRSANDLKSNELSNDNRNCGEQASTDTNALGEAVFGSVAMLLVGPAVKVHTLSTPRRLMLSSVFRCPHARTRTRQVSDRSVDSSYGSSVNSASDLAIDTSNGDLKPSSSSKFMVVANSVDKEESINDLECFSNCPLHSLSIADYGSATTISSGDGSSSGSLRRRWVRSAATAVARLDVDAEAAAGRRPRGGARLALAVILTSDNHQPNEMEQFLLERIALLVQMMTTIQYKAEKAYMHKDGFHQIMTDASSDAAQAIHDLFCCMRIEAPLWMSITSKSQHNTELRLDLLTKFIRDLSFLLQTLDTKNSNFFMSTLLTAVLTHHLGWVPTVSDQNESTSDHCCSKKGQLSALSEWHPYSALWAQLDDLKGALGTPSKVARTIVIGRSESLVVKVLSVLSYFVRCGRVQSRKESKIDNDDEKKLFETVTIPEIKTENTAKKTELLPENDTKAYFRRRMNGHFNRQNTMRSVKSGSNLVKQGSELDPALISDKVTKLCRVPRSAVENHDSPPNDNNLLSVQNRLSRTQLISPREKQQPSVEMKNSINSHNDRVVDCEVSVVVESPKTNGVVFMVGDDDRLAALTRLGNNNLEETDRPSDEVDFISSDFTNSCSSDTDEKDASDAKSKPTEHLESSHSFPDVLRAKQELDNSLSRSSDIGGVCREVRPAPVDRGKLKSGKETCEIDTSVQFACEIETTDSSVDCKQTDKPNVDCSRVYLAIPDSRRDEEETEVELAASVVGGVSDHYVQCMVVQGLVQVQPAPHRSWEADLRRDLFMEVRSPVLNQQHDEAVCIIADLDNCEVRVMSSRTPAIERMAEGGGGGKGVRAIMSRLVADMLDAQLHLCKMNVPPQLCAEHMEAKLDEFVGRSRTLAELLLSCADLMRMDTLTAALDVDASDVTLLMAIASVHTPQLASRCGITIN